MGSKVIYKPERRAFNPSRLEDQLELKFFLTQGKWKNGCPFLIEYPYEDIPTMCKEKWALYSLSLIEAH